MIIKLNMATLIIKIITNLARTINLLKDHLTFSPKGSLIELEGVAFRKKKRQTFYLKGVDSV